MDDEYVDLRQHRLAVRFYPSSIVPGIMIRLVTVRDAARQTTVSRATDRKWIGLRKWWRWRRLNRSAR